MKKQINNNIISGSIIFIFSLLILTILYGYPARTSFFPKIVTILITVLSLISVLTEIFKKRYYNITETVFFSKNYFVILFLIILYLFLIPKIGYYSSTFLFFNLSYFKLGLKITKGLIISVSILLFIFVFFQAILGLKFPSGILF